MVDNDVYVVRLIDLPYNVGAVVAMDETGFANIYLNARSTREKQRRDLRHELKHVKDDDAHNGKTIREAESG